LEERVKLEIRHVGNAGWPASLEMPRRRAEAIVEIGLRDHWPRFLFAIEPVIEEPPVVKLLAIFAFIKGYKAVFIPLAVALLDVVLALLAIELPTAHSRVYAVGVLTAVTFFGGLFAGHADGS
jgi:hypothetical protein